MANKNINIDSKSPIIFINRYFFPDHSATSLILSDLAFYLARQKLQIIVITSRQSYDNPRAMLPKLEMNNGVKIKRVWSSSFGRQNLIGRFIDYISFYITAFLSLLAEVCPGCVVIAKTDPPLISLVASIVAKLKSAYYINWIQDLFPEIANKLEVKIVKPIYSVLLYLRNNTLKSADINVVLGEGMAEVLIGEGIDEKSVKIIPNWSDGDLIKPLDKNNNRLREEWGLKDKFVIGYSGNLGRSHEFETIIDCAKILKDETNIVFLFIGGGAQLEQLKRIVDEEKLKNVIFKPYQSKENLSLSITLPDIHFVSLLPELEGLIVPSKFYGIAAAGRPTLFIGDTNGEIPMILKRHNCGISVKVGEAKLASKYIKELSSDGKKVSDMGHAARLAYDKSYSRMKSLGLWQIELRNLLMN